MKNSANPFKVFEQTDKDSAAAEEGEYLNQFLLENKKRPVLLMLSGGSSLAALEYIGPTALGENLTISVLDERFSQDPEINNFHQVQKTDFYTLAFKAEASFFGTLPRNEDTMESLAKRWEANLRAWRQENPNGLIAATLGMGADGHANGMLPYPEDEKEFNRLFKTENWITYYNAGAKNKFPERLTTNVTFMKNVDLGFALVCGAEKKPAFERLIKKQGQVHELPALAWHEIKEVKIFTDIN